MDTPDLTPTEPMATLATPEEAAPRSTPTRRVLKIVVTLQPVEGSAYRAILALGADGCDPLLRCLEAETLPAILAAVPALLTEAEARWAVQPRYPTTTPAKAKPRAAPPSPVTVPPPTTQPEDATMSPASPPPAGASAPDAPPPPPPALAPAGQLSLFG